MKIRVSDKNFGECEVNVYGNLDKCGEYTIKSLCMLQILCMNNEDCKDKRTEFMQILTKAVDDLNELYTETKSQIFDNDSDPTDQFGN